ncbi:MAG: hypothetical protein CFE46_11440 [Burkholderiales bacterium PBB6]|nr:MAG: hypothetical protein CFE46_11440 [Burkholderiales bacterium PBB6]
MSGATWGEMKRGMKGNDLKMNLLPRVPEILAFGQYMGRSENHKVRTDAFVAFHFFQRELTVGDLTVVAGVSVGERADGALAYGLNHSEHPSWAKRKAAFGDSPGYEPGAEEAALDAVSSTLVDSLGESDDGINVCLVFVKGVCLQ